jgi:hypothetical protein
MNEISFFFTAKHIWKGNFALKYPLPTHLLLSVNGEEEVEKLISILFFE